MFWMPPWKRWVHAAGMRPCEAMAGEPDPQALSCAYCGARLQPDGAGRLWEFTGRGHHWEHTGQTVAEGSVWSGGWEYVDDNWTDWCALSPSGFHEVVLRAAGNLAA
jgi:hypothetical protein